MAKQITELQTSFWLHVFGQNFNRPLIICKQTCTWHWHAARQASD